MSKLIKNIKLKMARLLVLPQVKAVIQLLQYIYNIFVHPINLKVLKINIGVITILQLMTPVVEFISWHSSEYYQLFVVWVMFGFGVYYTQFLKSIFVKHLFRLPCLGYFILAIIIVILDIVRYNSDFPVHEVQNFWIGFIFIYSAYYIGWFILFGLNFSKKWLVNNSVSIPVFGFLLPVYLLISTFGFTSTTLGWSGLIYFAFGFISIIFSLLNLIVLLSKYFIKNERRVYFDTNLAKLILSFQLLLFIFNFRDGGDGAIEAWMIFSGTVAYPLITFYSISLIWLVAKAWIKSQPNRAEPSTSRRSRASGSRA